jgi:hypothetical protein
MVLATGLFAQSGLKELGVSEAQAQREAVSVVADGFVPVHLAAKAFRAAAPSARAALVKGALSWARTYTQSAAFRTDYDRRREQDRPKAPASQGSVDDELARQRAEQRKGIEQARENLKNLSPEMRKQMEAVIKQMEEQVAKMEKDPQMAAMLRQGVEAQRADNQGNYQQLVAAHEKRFPPDPNTLIARRLAEFLEMSKDVDFGARLVPGPGGKQVFAEARYEDKPAEWKLCYRAGAEATRAAREFAADWLKTLGTR